MANAVTIQVLQDGPRNLVVKVVGEVNTADVTATDLFDPAAREKMSQVLGLATRFAIKKIEYSTTSGISLLFLEDATTDVRIAALNGQGTMCFKPARLSTEATGVTGKIQYATLGYASGTQTYMAVVYMTKYQV
jgi:hypothetical protein